MSPRHTLLVLLLWVYFIHFLSFAQGQESTKDLFQVQTGLDLIYDDNVWQYSNRDRESFKNNGNDAFFQKTKDLDDFIWEPYFSLSLQPLKWNPPTRLLADFSADFYTRNTSLNFGTYRLGLKQRFSDKTYILITYTWIPRVFAGISRERRGGTLVGETVTTHTIKALIQNEIGPLDLDLSAHYRFKNYNDAFNEQDSDIYGLGLLSRMYSAYRWNTRIEYQFEQGFTGGRNGSNVCTPFNNFTRCPNDISYFSNQFLIGPEVRINKPLTISLAYELKFKQFTTNLTKDPNHYGRKDTTHTLILNAYYQIRKNIEAKLAAERIARTTNKNKDFFEFQEKSATLGVSYFF